MNKLSQWFKKILDKWRSLTKKKKIAFGVIFVGILSALIWAGISLGSTKYAVLFSNMDSKDSSNIYNKLKEKKVDVKVQGNKILVPEEQVDNLRMEVMSEVPLTNGSKGFEILDESKFGATDQEIKIGYQRALQGELERTIKTFPQVENARVHLVLPQDTAFVKDVTPGNASVTLKLKSGKNLSKDQVKAIVGLISGSIKNVPKENVEVVDDKLTELSKDLFNEELNKDSTTSVEKQQKLKSDYEKKLEEKVLNILQPVYGKGKVKVKVNTDLNFDAIQNQSTAYNKENVVVSEHNVKDTNNEPKAGGEEGNDPNQNRIVNKDDENGKVIHEENTKNYNVPKTEQKVIKAPGEVERVTTSVIIDGNLTDQEKASVRNLVGGTVGYNEDRGNGIGDTINIEGMNFDTSLRDKAEKDLKEMENLAKKETRHKLYRNIGIILAILILVGIVYAIVRKKRRDEEEEIEGMDIIPEEDKTEKVEFKPIEFEAQDEKTHLENELRKYAKEKPDQVSEIVKAWLAEDEG